MCIRDSPLEESLHRAHLEQQLLRRRVYLEVDLLLLLHRVRHLARLEVLPLQHRAHLEMHPVRPLLEHWHHLLVRSVAELPLHLHHLAKLHRRLRSDLNHSGPPHPHPLLLEEHLHPLERALRLPLGRKQQHLLALMHQQISPLHLAVSYTHLTLPTICSV